MSKLNEREQSIVNAIRKGSVSASTEKAIAQLAHMYPNGKKGIKGKVYGGF